MSGTLVVIDIKIKKKSVPELGHSDCLKIYVNPSKTDVDPGFKIHLNGLFSETTAPMCLKFYMQHNQTSGLQNDKKFGMVENPRWPPMLNIAKPIKSTFSLECLSVWLKFGMEHLWDLGLEDYQNEKHLL